jgi:hypothetical protein
MKGIVSYGFLRIPRQKMISSKVRSNFVTWVAPGSNHKFNHRITPIACGEKVQGARYLTTREDNFRKAGILDEHGFTSFDTLHEMQVRSCMVYSGNDLFGTYNPGSEQFEYMTYQEFDEKVNQCRPLLKDLGKPILQKLECVSSCYIFVSSLSLTLALDV